MLKLIIDNSNVKNSKINERDAASQESEASNSQSETESLPPPPFLLNSFLADFREFSSNLYVFKAKDYNHELTCEMTLERKESFAYFQEGGMEQKYLVPVMTCNFPPIEIQRLNKKVNGHEYLQGILLFQFQLNILEQLFLFCENKDAVCLILAVHEADRDCLNAYRRFMASEKQISTAKGEGTEAVIPTDVETYDKVVDFIDEVDRNFRQTLWAQQKTNPLFREYLKRHSLAEF